MKGSFKVEYLETSMMPADGLTKALTQQQHEKFVRLLNMQDSRLLIKELEEKAP
jgi:succinate dehydrogenase flavin-adding protein (antitoxin of CptAB toxin-antitoxin module)